MIKNLAIIPARGGSKGVLRKNVREISGKPLIVHTIDFLKHVQEIDKIVVTTEDSEIKDISLQHGVEVIDRPASLATDTSLAMDAIRHAVDTLEKKNVEIENIFIFEATSPLRRQEDIVKCIEILNSRQYDSVATMSRTSISPGRIFLLEDETIKPLLKNSVAWMPRQSQPVAYQFDGILYGFSNYILKKENESFSACLGKTFPYITPYENVDIDTLFEFKCVERLLEIGYPEKIF